MYSSWTFFMGRIDFVIKDFGYVASKLGGCKQIEDIPSRYLLKVQTVNNSKNTRTMCEICSKLVRKKRERSILLTLNK